MRRQSIWIFHMSLSFTVKAWKEISISIFQKQQGLCDKGREEFLGYARQLIQQSELIEEKYSTKKQNSPSALQPALFICSKCFVDLVKIQHRRLRSYASWNKNLQLFWYPHLKSEIGILYLSDFNEKLYKIFSRIWSCIWRTVYCTAAFCSKKSPLQKRFVRELEA